MNAAAADGDGGDAGDEIMVGMADDGDGGGGVNTGDGEIMVGMVVNDDGDEGRKRELPSK